MAHRRVSLMMCLVLALIAVTSVPAFASGKAKLSGKCKQVSPYAYVPMTPLDCTASGGTAPYTFSATGLPPGLSMSPGGVVSGTPTVEGTYYYMVTLTDSAGDSDTFQAAIIVCPPKITLGCPSDTGMIGVPYSSSIPVGGGLAPYTFSISNGSLPPGLTLNTSTGAITGTPTAAEPAGGFDVNITDSAGDTGNNWCQIKITKATKIGLSCASGTANAGTAYSSALDVTGGKSPYTFSITGGSLPPGLTLNTSTGAITGSPTTGGDYDYTAQVVDSTSAKATASCSIDVTSATPLTLGCASSTAVVGAPYSSSLVAGGGTPSYTFSISIGSLPPGLTLNTSTGAITGTPTTGGTYDYTAKVVDSASGSTTANCSITPVVQGSCVPSSSLGVLVQSKNVTSYVPNGAWDTTITGLQVVPVEPTAGTPASITTPNTVNSCSSNSSTGETVCTANNTDVYLITGSTLNTTLTSGGNTTSGFSGGTCTTCGVAMNASQNEAVMTIGFSAATSGSAIQFLNLANDTLATPTPAPFEVSEDVLWDQSRNLVLSPDEDGNYEIFQTSPTLAAFGNAVGGTLDSAAEDCSTGIALASDEYTSSVFITDLTQATFTAGSPGTWTAPEQFLTFPEFVDFAAGTDGIAVAPGSHLAIVTGEFGGNWFGVLQLPSTSGTGTPTVVDYAAAELPNTPDGAVFEQGLDPHTVTAYVSPNSGDPIGLMANGYFVAPTYLAVIDLQKLLAAPRTVGTHYVEPTYDLVANGVVTYVATQ